MCRPPEIPYATPPISPISCAEPPACQPFGPQRPVGLGLARRHCRPSHGPERRLHLRKLPRLPAGRQHHAARSRFLLRRPHSGGRSARLRLGGARTAVCPGARYKNGLRAGAGHPGAGLCLGGRSHCGSALLRRHAQGLAADVERRLGFEGDRPDRRRLAAISARAHRQTAVGRGLSRLFPRHPRLLSTAGQKPAGAPASGPGAGGNPARPGCRLSGHPPDAQPRLRASRRHPGAEHSGRGRRIALSRLESSRNHLCRSEDRRPRMAARPLWRDAQPVQVAGHRHRLLRPARPRFCPADGAANRRARAHSLGGRPHAGKPRCGHSRAGAAPRAVAAFLRTGRQPGAAGAERAPLRRHAAGISRPGS